VVFFQILLDGAEPMWGGLTSKEVNIAQDCSVQSYIALTMVTRNHNNSQLMLDS